MNGYKDELVSNCDVEADTSIDTGKRAIPKKIIGDSGNRRCDIRTFEMTRTGQLR